MKKAFTLVEMLSIIVIMGVILSLILPNMIGISDEHKQSEYNKLLNKIYMATETYLVTSLNNEKYPIKIKLQDIIDEGYLESDLTNPLTEEAIDNEGYILVTKNNDNTLTFNYPNIIDIEAPTITFSVNGTLKYVATFSTKVTVSDDIGVDEDSLLYLWTTSTIAPTEESFTTSGISFDNEDIINTPSEVTGTYYLWILAKDINENTAIIKSNAYILNGVIPVIIFTYTEELQTFTVGTSGTYKIELWGASGAGFILNNLQVSYGAYTSGEIHLDVDDEFCILTNFGVGYSTNNYGGASGGSTDIRYNCNGLLTTESLVTRIMVAGGGGGAGYNSYAAYQGGVGGSAGGLTGYNGGGPNYNAYRKYAGGGGTTIVGGNYGVTNSGEPGDSGSFGIGGAGGSLGWPSGGGGYYGGGAGGYYHQSSSRGGGGGGAGGGSSFISGHTGCNAVNSSGVATGNANHYSGYVFTNTVMIDGNGYNWTSVKGSQIQMPSQEAGSYYELGVGSTGTGYARITYISRD